MRWRSSSVEIATQTWGRPLRRIVCWSTHINFHVEGTSWRDMVGQMLKTQAGITSPGTADSFLKEIIVSRTRHAQQVTALAQATLQEDNFLFTDVQHTVKTKEAWGYQLWLRRAPRFSI